MVMRKDNPILLAETIPDSATDLAVMLRCLGYRPHLACTCEMALDVLRREIVGSAVVAVELTDCGEPMLARLATLPSMRQLLAVGPADGAFWELRARRAGAGVYLPRPVTLERLTQALGGCVVYDPVARSP
jgi:ActR/RegA family two-component response regulator